MSWDCKDIYMTFLGGWVLSNDTWHTGSATFSFGYFKMDGFLRKYLIDKTRICMEGYE
jgi:hypothetical protein